MDTPNTHLLQTDRQGRIASLRRKNNALIIGIFSLTIVTALLTGSIFFYLISSHYYPQSQSQQHQWPFRNSALRHFCSYSYPRSKCITSLAFHIKTTPSTNPDHIFLLCLEKSANQLSEIQIKKPSTNCSSSLTKALNRINDTLGVIRLNPDLKLLTNEQYRNVIVWVKTVVEELGSCMDGLKKKNETTTDVDVDVDVYEVRAKVDDVMMWMSYSKEFLLACDSINDNFQLEMADTSQNWRREMFDDLLQVTLFGSQYVVLVIFFCLFFLRG